MTTGPASSDPRGGGRDGGAAVTRLTVNGAEQAVTAPASTPLALVLRNELGLKGVRVGCGIGECGACTVVVDGRATRSCSTPLEAVAGCSVATPEGLGTPTSPGAVQQAFLVRQAGQCGYCVNGMTMAVAALAANGPVDEAQLLGELDTHLCRCGSHRRLLAAARAAVGIAHDDDRPRDPVAPPSDIPVDEADVPVGLAVESRLRLLPDGVVEVLPGKVELGQGIRTAFAQVVAAHLGISVDQVVVRSVTTGVSPDEAFTSGSTSLDEEGVRLACAATALRRLLAVRAAALLGAAPEQIEIDGVVRGPGGAVLSLDVLAAAGPITGVVEPSDRPRWGESPLGHDVPRDDLAIKLTGAPAYVHDVTLPGMVHARVLLPPRYDAELVACDPTPARELPGVLDVVVDGRLLLVVAEQEHQAVRARDRLAAHTSWTGGELATPEPAPRAVDHEVRRNDPLPIHDDALHHVTARYSKPYEAHAPIAPSCAVAEERDGRLHVIAHTQGAYPLAREIARLVGLDAEQVTVEHGDGPGCYGHTCADDAAALAAVTARRLPGRPVRLLLDVDDEFAWEPYGPALRADLEAWLDTHGRIVGWRAQVVSDVHDTRPRGAGDCLIPAWLRESRVPRPRPSGAYAARNAVPLYDIPALAVRADYVAGPLRTSALRSLGAYGNLFAVESFVDELAEAAGQDPLAFRLRHLTDRRARAVLEAAADRGGWQSRVGASGRGLGLAVGRYKDVKAYAAVLAHVRVDTTTGDVRVERVVVACDAGGVVNPDGAHNQIEGGVMQGLSRTLHEAVRFGAEGIRTRDWTTYPVLAFSEVPDVDVMLLDRRRSRPLGVGESVTPLVPAAVANAVDDAIGVRVRSLPLTAARLRARLEELDDDELARVRL